jgi:hypothetical protein
VRIGSFKKITRWIVSFLLIVIVGTTIIVILTSRSSEIRLNDYWTVRVRRAPLIQSCHGSTCTMTFLSIGKETNTVVLGQDLFDSPAFILCSANSNVFYCIYDFDVDWQLIRIDQKQPFKPPSTKNPLQAVIRPSDCKVDRVPPRDVSDWDFAAKMVEEMSRSQFHKQSLGFGLNQERLVKILRSSGEQGQYSEDPAMP